MMVQQHLKILILPFIFMCTSLTHAGWFAQQSESYLIGSRHSGGGLYQCTYKTNPGNRGWRRFEASFQGGCPRFVYFNAQTGQVSVPN